MILWKGGRAGAFCYCVEVLTPDRGVLVEWDGEGQIY